MRQKTGFPSGRTDEEFGTNRRHIQNEVIRERCRNVAGEILSNAKDPVNIGGGGWTRTNDLRIMRCTFRRAATWIQPLAVGPSDLKWDQMSSIGAELATLVATRKYDDLNPDPLVPDQIQASWRTALALPNHAKWKIAG